MRFFLIHSRVSSAMMRKYQILILGCISISAFAQDLGCSRGKECRQGDDCPEFVKNKELLKSLTRGSTKYNTIIRELKGLICNKREKKICCIKEKAEQPQPTTQSSSPSWVPSKREGCGLSFDPAGFIVGGNDTKLGEFPWTVLLGRKGSSGQSLWKCGGTLINRWYVLTAAHCKNSMDIVRVGEWEVVDTRKIKPDENGFNCTAYSESQCRRNRNNRNCEDGCTVDPFNGQVDCMAERRGRETCGERHQDIEVEEVNIHKDFRKFRSGLVVNDIALLKLKYPVDLNKFVTPICLGDEEENNRLRLYGEPGKTGLLSYGRPTVVGWGKTNTVEDFDISIVSSAKQQKLDVPVVSNSECRSSWNKLWDGIGQDIKLEEHICAGGEEGKDSCNGDSGGPLVGRDGEDNPYMMVGVVSAGTKTCGLGTPAIYTRVAHFRDWIIKHLV
eukprot:TRINITY_DN5586_c0_g1_i4.p1 TRINITY_DN5586_c0_g1~~TRINITY_DN5586_c0_g1_i4.p1  ORF type:complete len:444 (+),score=80.88 TRINITY_DN5586_c0_g1_i4:24-1355(+)